VSKLKAKIKQCSNCQVKHGPLYSCEGGFICDSCLQTGLQGKDFTTKAARLIIDADELLNSNKPLTKENRISIAATRGMLLENLSPLATVDAATQRIELLDKLGTDCVALGVDTAHSMDAKNSLDTMLAHQLAVAHKTALEITSKGMLEADPIERARTLNLAARFMDTFQRGLLASQRLKTGGVQNITVHYATVGEGGQAIVGNVQAGGQRK
jgi:hypothetical protein